MKQKSFLEIIHMESGLQEEVAKDGKKRRFWIFRRRTWCWESDVAKGFPKKRDRIQSAVNEAKKILGFTEKEVIEIDSIDLKKEEKGLLSYAAKWKLPFYTFSAEELGKVKCVSSHSEFVRKVTGVDNVCERAAILAAGEDGRLLMPKQCMNRVTIAVAEKKVRIRI